MIALEITLWGRNCNRDHTLFVIAIVALHWGLKLNTAFLILLNWFQPFMAIHLWIQGRRCKDGCCHFFTLLYVLYVFWPRRCLGAHYQQQCCIIVLHKKSILGLLSVFLQGFSVTAFLPLCLFYQVCSTESINQIFSVCHVQSNYRCPGTKQSSNRFLL